MVKTKETKEKDFITKLIEDKRILNITPQGRVYVGNKELVKEEIKDIVGQVQSFERSFVWQLLSQEVRDVAVSGLINAQADNSEEIRNNQALIKNLETMQILLNKLKQL